MKKRHWLLLMVSFALPCSPLLAAPYLYRQIFPQLDEYSDTKLADQSFQPQLNLNACRFSFIHQQWLTTTEARETIWRRLPAQWGDGTGRYSSFFDQTIYEKEITAVWRMRSWVHYESAAPRETPVSVRNSITIQLC